VVPGHIINPDGFPRISIGYLEAVTPHPDAAVGADLFIGFHSEKIVNVLGKRDLLKRLPLVDKFAVEGGHIQSGVDGLMVQIDPLCEVGIEFLESGFGFSRQKAVPQGTEEAFNFPAIM
jgi:hypothetical protein